MTAFGCGNGSQSTRPARILPPAPTALACATPRSDTPPTAAAPPASSGALNFANPTPSFKSSTASLSPDVSLCTHL